MEEMNDGGQLDLEYDFYSETCPETETIVRSTMMQITLTRRMSLLSYLEERTDIVMRSHKFDVFKANPHRVARHQRLVPLAQHGVTRGLKLPVDATEALILPTKNLPEDFDWREYEAVTAVKNKGLYRSCWSFSTTGALEGAHYLATEELVSLSEQQLVDCNHEKDLE
ncbi:hypothetical protein ACFX2I_024794 [Malus domestica]